MAAHWHKFDKTGRLPNGTVRRCSACGETQIKRGGKWQRLALAHMLPRPLTTQPPYGPRGKGGTPPEV